MNDILWIASFDIGKVNFSFYIEETSREQLKIQEQKLMSIPKNQRYKDDGTPSVLFQELLDNISTNGKKILLENVDLTYNCNKKLKLDPLIYYNMIDTLNIYKEYWDQCDVFVIEQQMSFGKVHNTMALKLGQHCYSYFSIKYYKEKKIVEFPAYNKTQILGASKLPSISKGGKVSYKTMDKPARKKWSIKKALDILSLRGDSDTIELIKSSTKKDDLCDTITQLTAFKFIMYVNKE